MSKLSPKKDTGQALGAPLTGGKKSKPPIVLRDVRQNNLKGFDLALQRGRFTVVTGPSGSGKSSLAFDTLYAEGQRRYVESLSTYVRQFLERMPRPDVESVQNIPPAIALEQRNTVRSSRSTVATATEIYDYLRLLFATAGTVHCEQCAKAVEPEEPGGFADRLLKSFAGESAVILFDAFTRDEKPKARQTKLAELQAAGFVRTWADGKVGRVEDFIGNKRPPPSLRIAVDRVALDEERRTRLAEAIAGALDQGLGFASAAVGNEILHTASRFACADCRLTYERPVPRLFSFNSPFGACPECKGFGNLLELDRDLIVPDRGISLSDGAIEPFTKPSYTRWMHALLEHASARGVDLSAPIGELAPEDIEWIFSGGKTFPGVMGYFRRLEAKKYKLHVRVFLSRYKSESRCEACSGARLNAAARSVLVADKRIDEITGRTFAGLRKFLVETRDLFLGNPASERILNELTARCDYALEVGLGYLTLDRQMRTLSGGEAQRIGLANQLGSGLTDTLYVLDEPTIGLHPHNTERLLHVLRNLVERGNTLVVVEHDPDVIRQADDIVELGPGSGEHGGELIYAGRGGAEFLKEGTLTADYLVGAKEVPLPGKRRTGNGKLLSVLGASENNLRGVDFHVPLGTLTCVTGVSGSGKSTLVHQTLYGALARVFGIEYGALGKFDEIHGLNFVRGAVLIDQQPIGKTARSIPASYVGIYDDIRKLFSQTLDARLQNFKPGHFSFNVAGGRCDRCNGMGSETVEMHFLSDVEVECDVCEGSRFKTETLAIKYKDKNIADVLNMTVDEAAKFFLHERRMMDRLRMMQQVGLGYLRLGQPARTLSGGESQRLKISGELGVKRDKTLYILDEPTTGLHMDEVALLLKVLNHLVDKGNTVLVIEHNLDVVKASDWVIDMGPGGGDAGGRIVAEGTPEELVTVRKSVTGRYLKGLLKTDAQLSL